MIKMCGNKEVVFVWLREIKELPLISFLGIAVCLFPGILARHPSKEGNSILFVK